MILDFVYFYPRPPYGGRPLTSDRFSIFTSFLSTPSVRRATVWEYLELEIYGHFYPRPPYGGRQRLGDVAQGDAHFYPRPPYGGRPGTVYAVGAAYEFLSTPSVRRATVVFLLCVLNQLNFYPRPPYGGRRFKLRLRKKRFIFLSTPSVRRATRLRLEMMPLMPFLSTPSVRRAT